MDQSDQALVFMYRKINACSADSPSSSDIVTIVASVLSIVAAIAGAIFAYHFKLCHNFHLKLFHNVACCGGTVVVHSENYP